MNCCSLDYNECDPTLGEHREDCRQHSMCENTFGSYTCKCLIGYEKHSLYDFCVSQGIYYLCNVCVTYVVIVNRENFLLKYLP